MPVRLMPAAAVSGEILDEYNDPVQDVEIRLLAVRCGLARCICGCRKSDDR